jgi:hypothetical protein
MEVPDRLRLPLEFDADLLAADLGLLTVDDWVPHFNTTYYSGDWSGVALRSIGGKARQLYPDPASTEPYADTEILDRCPNIRAALDQLHADKCAVRLLRLGPGARVREHQDYRLGYSDGEVRLHVPVTSSPGAGFLLSGTPLEMAPGECWYVDVNCPHSVWNEDHVPRVHLVVDCLVNTWIEQRFAESLSGELRRA